MTINNSIIIVGKEAASNMAGAGLFVEALPNTPLAELVGAVYVDGEAGDNIRIESSEQYDTVKEGFADFAADRMAALMDFTRNTVRPAIEAVEKRVAEAIKGIVYDPFKGLSLTEQSYPDILEDESFVASIAHYHSGRTITPSSFPKLNTRSDKEIIEMMATGNAAWDLSVKQWVASLNEGTLQTVWNNIFAFHNSNRASQGITSIESIMKDFNNGGFSALIVFLLASRLRENIDDEFGMGLEEARRWCYEMMEVSATAIRIGIERYNTIVSTGSLIVSRDISTNNVTVNKRLYKEYLANGGKPDTLFGMLISGSKVSTVKEIQDNEKDFNDAWNMYTSSREAEALSGFNIAVKSMMIEAFNAELSNPFGPVEEEELANPGVLENAKKIFREELGKLPQTKLSENWIDVLWRLVVKSRFHYNTTAYLIIDLVNYEVSKGADPKDASTVAYETAVAKFVAEMLKAV